ncbi:cupin domain-containing protein [Streptomyces sp. NPDC004752]
MALLAQVQLPLALAQSLPKPWSGGQRQQTHQANRTTALREAERPRFERGEGGAYKTLVSTRPDSAVDMFVGHFPPGASNGAAYTHGNSSEVLPVLQGSVLASVDGQEYLMTVGTSLKYRTSVPHQLRNASTGHASVLWAVSPPTSGT